MSVQSSSKVQKIWLWGKKFFPHPLRQFLGLLCLSFLLSLACTPAASNRSAPPDNPNVAAPPPTLAATPINRPAIVFPNDAGIINITGFGAIPNDGQDDTAAIQAAISAHPTKNHIFYFPNGTYDISDMLTLAGSQKRNIFQGESEQGTVLRLMDNVPSTYAKAILNFGPAPAQRFRNAIRDMTVNVGRNHPTSIGVQFNASNQGTAQNVTILSEDRKGNIGLDMSYTDEIGPLLIKTVTVNGFDYGIKTRWPTASQTFENITLLNQNICGWRNTNSQKVFARKVRSQNTVSAIINDGEASFVLLDSTLTGSGAAASEPAISNQKSMYIDRTQTTGYKLAVKSNVNWGRGNGNIPNGKITNYLANGFGKNRKGGPVTLFPSANQMLGLPIKETPDIPWETDLSKWDGPHKHLLGTSGLPDDDLDDTPSIQAAIDSGATTVYLPRGTWTINQSLELRNNVRRLMGTEAKVKMAKNAVIRVGPGKAPSITIERLEKVETIEHTSQRTLVLNNLLGFHYVPKTPTPGDVFINDCVGSSVIFKNQNVWARQLNLESNTQSQPNITAKVLNDNARVWILGYKTEDEGTTIKTINGGKTELFGAAHVGSGVSNPDNPRFITEDSSFSVAGIYGKGFSIIARETRKGKTQTTDDLKNADAYIAYPQ